MWQLLNTINIQLAENKLPQNILEKVFSKNWSDFEEKFAVIQQMQSQSVTKQGKRESEDILMGLLNTVRSFDKRLQNVEQVSNNDYFNKKSHESNLFEEYRAERNEVSKYETERMFEFISNLVKQGRSKDDILTKALAKNKLFSPGTVLKMVESGLERMNSSVN